MKALGSALILLAGILAYFLPRRWERSALRDFRRGGATHSDHPRACHGCAEVD